MVFQNPLTSVQVRHFIPGRVRLKIGRIHWTPRKAMECQAFFQKMEGIKGVEVQQGPSRAADGRSGRLGVYRIPSAERNPGGAD